MRQFQFFANRYQHDSEHHFWQFGNQPVDIEKIAQKGKPTPSPLGKLLQAGFVDDSVHYIYCSAYPGQKVRLTPDPALVNKK
jgi:hypothetical protein